jgi:riboflavin synthase
MFSGIVLGAFPITEVVRQTGLMTITVELSQELTAQLYIGASVAVDGVCLTVTRLNEDAAEFDMILETIRVTALQDLEVGSLVNIELSLTGNRDISGHIVSGHVDDVVRLEAIERPDENNCTLVFSAKPRWMKYIFPKGYISLNGCSLTVGYVDREKSTFCVYLIPETLRRTTFGLRKVGDAVNVEVERQTQAIVDTINSFLERLESKLLSGTSSAKLLEDLVPELTGKLGK